MGLASGRQADGGDDDAARVEETARFCRVELGRCHGSGAGEIMDGVYIGGRAAEVRSGCREVRGEEGIHGAWNLIVDGEPHLECGLSA